MGKNKQLTINIIAQLISFIVNMGINFLLTPFIVKNIGSEAYGFVGLANNFVIYAQLVTIALNSMAGRFLTIKIYQNDKEGSNKYFTSIFFANIITAVILIIPSILIILNLNKLINVSNDILYDIKLLWLFTFLNFIINIIFSTYNIATFAKNRLDLSSRIGIITNFIKVIILVIAFSFFPSSVWYIGLSAVICTIYNLLCNIYYTKKLLPEIQVRKKYFDFNVIKEIISSGIWNTLTKLSQIFSSGLDLLITNIFISSKDMGVLALAKTIPNFIINFVISISSVFNPQITILYAKNDKEELVSLIKYSMKLIAIISSISNAILLIFGTNFFKLWVPEEDIVKLQILSFITLANSCITGPLQPIYQVFTVTNKVKKNSIVMLIYGIVSILLTLILLRITNLGIYLIAGVSCVLCTIVSIVFHIPYGAKCLGLNRRIFYPEIGRSVLSFILLSFVYFFIKLILPSKTWFSLFFCFFVCGCIGLFINIFLILNKKERKIVGNLVLSKIYRR